MFLNFYLSRKDLFSFFFSFFLVFVQGMFQEFGEIIMTKVVRDKNTKKSLGYGFVKFALDADATRAMEKMHGSTMGHKMLKVSIARPPSLEIRNCKLYVTNLPKEFGEREVVNLFQEVRRCNNNMVLVPL